MRTSRFGFVAAFIALCACGGSSGDSVGGDADIDGGGTTDPSDVVIGFPSSGNSSGRGQADVMCDGARPCGCRVLRPDRHCAGTLDTACGKSGACIDCSLLGQTCSAASCLDVGSGSGASSGGSSGGSSGARSGASSGSGSSGRDAGGADASSNRDASGNDAAPDATPRGDSGGSDGGVEAGAGRDASSADGGVDSGSATEAGAPDAGAG